MITNKMTKKNGSFLLHSDRCVMLTAMESKLEEVQFECESSGAYIVKWKVKPGSKITQGTVLLLYRAKEDKEQDKPEASLKKWKAVSVGTVIHLLKQEGDLIHKGCPVLNIKGCSHPVVMKDMCAECGADLREEKTNDQKSTASVAMVHCIPELMVSQEQAQILGKADEERLFKNRRLVLLVDLDQTLIHTTNDEVDPNLKDVYHFKLYGSNSLWYHTKIRPGTRHFLEEIKQMYELHICTFGSRLYAHTVTPFIDKDGSHFSHRILSRDECCSANSKTANLSALFPCGDNLVCIIDDREDVWNFVPNLVHVKPYHYFLHTGDINAPPGLTKVDLDENGAADVKIGNYKRSKQSGKVNKRIKAEKKEELSYSTETLDLSVAKEPPKDEVIEETVNQESKEISELPATDDPVKSEVKEETIIDLSVAKVPPKDEVSEETVNHESKKISELPTTDDPVKSEIKEETIIQETIVSAEKETVCEETTVIKGNVNQETIVSIEKVTVIEETTVIEEDVDVQIKKTTGSDSNNTKADETEMDTSEKKQISTEDSDKVEKELDDDNDDYLLYLTDILKNIYSEFYRQYDKFRSDGSNEMPDLKRIVPLTRKQTLKGVYIVFSGIVPINMPLEKSKVYFVAKSLGAEIQKNIILPNGSQPATTHVVAARMGTVKVNEAKRVKGIHVVTPDWLWCCSERWDRVDEKLFPLTRDKAASHLFNPKDRLIVFDSSDHMFSDLRKEKQKAQASSVAPDVFPTYDPVTGKRINKVLPNSTNAGTYKSSSSAGQNQATAGPSTASNKNSSNFATSINPLMAFSTEDIARMGQEVDDEMDDSDSDESVKDSKEPMEAEEESSREEPHEQTSSSSGESLSADYPRKWANKRKGNKTNNRPKLANEANDLPRFPRGELPWDSDGSQDENGGDSEDDFANSIGSADEEMVAAVEREFLEP